MSKKPKITLRVNNILINNPCALCGARCDPCGLDYFLGETKRPVCDQCAEKYVPEIVAARTVGLDFTKSEIETVMGEVRRKTADLLADLSAMP